MVEKTTGLPVKQDLFLEAGVHIGTRIKTNDMKKYIFKKRDDGLYILDLRKTAERLLSAAKLISKYDPKDILIVASRVYSSNPAAKFSKLTGIPVLPGRFVPGTMTNLVSRQFREPKLVFVCDPKGEREAIMESAKNGVPVIALCDTDNDTKYVDMVIPINNKGRRSLALVFYILAREIMLSQEKIKSYDDFQHNVSYFERLEDIEEEKKVVITKEEGEEAKEEKPAEAPKEEKVKKAEEKKETKKKEEKAPEKKPEEKKAEEKKPKPEEEEKPKKPKRRRKKKAEEKKETKKSEEKPKEKKEEAPKEEKPKEEPKKEEKPKEEKPKEEPKKEAPEKEEKK